MVNQSARRAMGLISRSIDNVDTGRRLSDRAVVSKGSVSTFKDGRSTFKWKVVKDPREPNIPREDYDIEIIPQVNRSQDLTGYKLVAGVEAVGIRRPFGRDLITGLDRTRGSCLVGFSSTEKMNVRCTQSQTIGSGRLEDMLESGSNQALLNKASTVVKTARNKIYTNFK